MSVLNAEFAIGLKLAAENATEQRVLDYLAKNASPVLVAKINDGKKTLAGALDYAKGEASKLAKGAGCICVDDVTVYGWIIHYFEEDTIAEKAKRTGVKLPGGVKKTAPAPKKESQPKAAAGPIALELFSSAELQGAPC